jgi:hypothetical protein
VDVGYVIGSTSLSAGGAREAKETRVQE